MTNYSGSASVVVTPTIQAAAYANGNAIGGLQTVPCFRDTSGILTAVNLAWAGVETVGVTFFIFDSLPSAGTTVTDKAPFVLGTVDVQKLAIPPFTLTAAAPSVGTTATFASSSFVPTAVRNRDSPPGQVLYIAAVSGGAFTPAVGDLSYRVAVAQDL